MQPIDKDQAQNGREMKKRGIAYMVMILREDGKLAYVLDKEIPENA